MTDEKKIAESCSTESPREVASNETSAQKKPAKKPYKKPTLVKHQQINYVTAYGIE